MSKTTSTTFFALRAVGPYVTMAEHSAFKAGHRRGHWSCEALLRLAARHGMELVSAYSIARDDKGWIPASRRDIVA